MLIFPISFLLIARKQKTEKFLINGIIISLPLSFINIFGGDYGSLPLSWYNLFCVGYILNGLLKRECNTTGKQIGIMLLCTFIVSTLFSYDFSISIKSLLTTSLTCLVMIVFWKTYFPTKYSKEDLLEFGRQFITATCSTAAVMLFFKIIWMRGIVFESSGIMDAGVGRVGNKFLFSDYSFISVFLAIGATYCFFFPFNRKWKQIVLPALLLLACIDTTARSGFAALLIFGVFFLSKKILLQSSARYALLLIPLAVGAFFIIHQLSSRRDGQSMIDGSGRIENMKIAVPVIRENFLLGVGPGAKVYQNYVVNMHGVVNHYEIPHNIVFQSLAYYGCIGFLVLSVFFLYLFRNCENNPESKAFYVCMFGSLFIPDIFVSRFFLVIVILMWISKDCGVLKNYDNH